MVRGRITVAPPQVAENVSILVPNGTSDELTFREVVGSQV